MVSVGATALFRTLIFLTGVLFGRLCFPTVGFRVCRTSDEHISIAQFLKASNVDGAIIVTTPQEVSIIDVRKEINFCKKVS